MSQTAASRSFGVQSKIKCLVALWMPFVCLLVWI